MPSLRLGGGRQGQASAFARPREHRHGSGPLGPRRPRLRCLRSRLRRFDKDGKQLWEKDVPGVAWGVNLAREGRLILAAYADGTIRWHRAADGEELLALFIHVPEDPK